MSSSLIQHPLSGLITTQEGGVVSVCSPLTRNRCSCFSSEHNKRGRHRLCMQPLDRKPLFVFRSEHNKRGQQRLWMQPLDRKPLFVFRSEHNKRGQQRLCMQPLDLKSLFVFQGWTQQKRAASSLHAAPWPEIVVRVSGLNINGACGGGREKLCRSGAVCDALGKCCEYSQREKERVERYG